MPLTITDSSNYLLKIQILDVHNPCIVRILSCPPTTTFAVLHLAIQIVFGWTDQHPHKFEIVHKKPSEQESPPPGDFNPRYFLHTRSALTIQRGPGERDDDPDDFDDGVPRVNPKNIHLKDVFESPEYDDKAPEYEYDFGDCWVHDIELIGRATKDTEGKIVCVAGEGHGIAEACGGPCGWEQLKEAYVVPEDVISDQDKELRRWYEEVAGNGESAGLDLWKWNREEVNKKLAMLEEEMESG